MSTDLEIAIPPGWEVAHDVAPDVPLMLSARAAPGVEFVPTAAVTVAPTGLPLVDYQTGLRAEVTADLESVEIDEVEVYDDGEEQIAYLRVWHRVEGADVVTEMWTSVVDGLAWTVIGSVGARDYADYADVLETVAASFRPIGPDC